MTTPENVGQGTQVSFGVYPTRTWRANPDTGRLSGVTDGVEAMRQAVEIALNVRRFHWQIYSPRIGHEIDVIGTDFDTASMGLRAAVEDALTVDDRITGVSNFRFSRDEDAILASFTVQTVFGSLRAEVRT